MRKIIATLTLLLLFCVSFTGCFDSGDPEAATDYSDSQNWMQTPSEIDKKVDVFFLYTDCWHRSSEEDPKICSVDSESMRMLADQSIEGQASLFATVANIYIPYYRQADEQYWMTMSPDKRDEILMQGPQQDVIAAFDYYIHHYNGGRPFILAGHSQGSALLLSLLSDYMQEHPEVYERMVACYAIGYSVTEDYLEENPHLKFAESNMDTGVIISYNTQAPTMQGEHPTVLEGAIAINPITWTRGSEHAAAERSKGSLIRLDNSYETVRNFADAQVDGERGVVLCASVDPQVYLNNLPELFSVGCFHDYDYPFYYYDLQYNAQMRVDNYLAEQG